jgi:hypothetical protein
VRARVHLCVILFVYTKACFEAIICLRRAVGPPYHQRITVCNFVIRDSSTVLPYLFIICQFQARFPVPPASLGPTTALPVYLGVAMQIVCKGAEGKGSFGIFVCVCTYVMRKKNLVCQLHVGLHHPFPFRLVWCLLLIFSSHLSIVDEIHGNGCSSLAYQKI